MGFKKIKRFFQKWWIPLLVGILSLICGLVLITSPKANIKTIQVLLLFDLIPFIIYTVGFTLTLKAPWKIRGFGLLAGGLLILCAFMIGFKPLQMKPWITLAFWLKGMGAGILAHFAKTPESKEPWACFLAGLLTLVFAEMVFLHYPNRVLWISLAFICFGTESLFFSERLGKAKAFRKRKRIQEKIK